MGGGRGVGWTPLLLWTPLPQRPRRCKMIVLSLNPFAPKARNKLLPQTVEGEEWAGGLRGGGGVKGGGGVSSYGCQPF